MAVASRADFGCECGTRQHRKCAASAQNVPCDLVGEQSTVGFKALGGPGQPHPGAEQRLDLPEHGTKGITGNDDQYIQGTGQLRGEVGPDAERIGEVALRQVAAVGAFANHLRHLAGVTSPQPGRLAAAGKLDGERRAPRARPQYRDGRPGRRQTRLVRHH